MSILKIASAVIIFFTASLHVYASPDKAFDTVPANKQQGFDLDFAGTGGLGYPLPNGIQVDYQNAWYKWKDSMGFGAKYPAQSHAGDAFGTYLKTENLAKANWFIDEEARRYGRIKIEMPEAVEAFKKFVHTQYEWQKKNPYITLGVDPADGRGGNNDPLPPDGFAGIKKWNHADKWWWLANEVAKDYMPGGKYADARVKVQMYAYGDGSTNALVPKFKLLPNIQVLITPYAFQRAYSPAEMVEVWTKFHSYVSIYDYLSITQWGGYIPQTSLYSWIEKFKFWHKMGIKSVQLESTDGFGPLRHYWYVLKPLAANPRLNVDSTYHAYLKKEYGKAAPIFKTIFDEWSLNFQGAGQWIRDMHNIKKAAALEPRRQSIYDAQAYNHFMKMVAQHDYSAQSKDRIMDYLYAINNRLLVQASPIAWLEYIAPQKEPDFSRFKGYFTNAQIDSIFNRDMNEAPPPYYVSAFVYDFKKASFKKPLDSLSFKYGRSPNIYFYPANKTLSFEAGTQGIVKLMVSSDDGNIITDSITSLKNQKKIKIAGNDYFTKKYNLNTLPGKRYSLSMRGSFNSLRINNEIVYEYNYADAFDNAGFPLHYLYIPKDMEGKKLVFEDRIAYLDHYKGPAFALPGISNWADTTLVFYGSPIKQMPGIYEIPVRKEWVGKVVVIAAGYPGWRFLNIPNVLALNEFDYKE